tara:strand:+ start:115 stop:492 length:378 start_codon:yes stop_codon:yes gene_type:complete
MKTHDLEELARRSVACKRWRWMPGMLSETGLRVTRRDDDGYVVGYYENLSYIAQCVPGTLPDLSDPATLGCLLALVREAWNNPNVTSYRTHPMTKNPPWKVEISMRLFCGDNEVEALVAALEAAR